MSEPYNAMDNKEPDEEKKTIESHPMNDISKVSKKSSPFAFLGWSVLGVIVISVLLSSFSHSGKKTKLNDDLQSKVDYQRQLAENMAAIQQAKLADSQAAPTVSNQQTAQSVQSVKPPEPTPEQLADFQARLEVAEQKRAQEEADFQARLKAPTSLLINPPSADQFSAQSAATGTGTAQAVFAGGGANSSFGNQNTDVVTVSATQIAHPDSTIASGELIKATLETPINSDLPGMVRATVEFPVYAYTGNTPLIPAGSRLIGQYSSGIVQGQSRIMVVWNRVILPNGVSAQLNSPGTDSMGVSGQGADSVNRHFWEQFGEATFLSILGAGTATAGVSSSDQYNSASQYRSAVSDSLNQTASQTFDQNGSIKPTITVNQGKEINIFVARDVDFSGLDLASSGTGGMS